MIKTSISETSSPYSPLSTLVHIRCSIIICRKCKYNKNTKFSVWSRQALGSKSLRAGRAQLELYHISVFPPYLFLGLFFFMANDNGLSIETAMDLVCFFGAF